MYTVNIIVSNTQRQTEPIHDPYKKSPDDIIVSNVENIVAKTINTKPGLLKQSIRNNQACTSQDVLQLSDNFGQVANRKNKHFSSSVREKSYSRLPPGIMPPDHSAINTNSISNDCMK